MGHPECHRQAVTVVIGGQVVDLLDDPDLIAQALPVFGHLAVDRSRPWRAAGAVLARAARHPRLWPRAARYLGRKLWEAGPLLARGGFRPRKLMFFVQNFQDREHLDPDRIALCSFQVMTQNGPVSMCLHNARRDDYILPANQPGAYAPAPVFAASGCGGCGSCQ